MVAVWNSFVKQWLQPRSRSSIGLDFHPSGRPPRTPISGYAYGLHWLRCYFSSYASYHSLTQTDRQTDRHAETGYTQRRWEILEAERTTDRQSDGDAAVREATNARYFYSSTAYRRRRRFQALEHLPSYPPMYCYSSRPDNRCSAVVIKSVTARCVAGPRGVLGSGPLEVRRMTQAVSHANPGKGENFALLPPVQQLLWEVDFLTKSTSESRIEICL